MRYGTTTEEWGQPCEVPDGARAIWGARASFKPRDKRPLDLLGDRQDGAHHGARENGGIERDGVAALCVKQGMAQSAGTAVGGAGDDNGPAWTLWCTRSR